MGFTVGRSELLPLVLFGAAPETSSAYFSVGSGARFVRGATR
jgi:hypothetical protein